MSQFGKHGVRCDWCGKVSNRNDGEYRRPSRFGYQLAGYIRQPEWERNNRDASGNHDPIESDRDICEECKANLCPHCGAAEIVRISPSTPGPSGWGHRCRACGERWYIPE